MNPQTSRLDEGRAVPILVGMKHFVGRSWWRVAVCAFVVGCGGGGSSRSRTPQAAAARRAAAARLQRRGSERRLTTRVHVSTSGDADGCGATTASACATIQKGIAACGNSGCGVIVRHGVYTGLCADRAAQWRQCLWQLPVRRRDALLSQHHQRAARSARGQRRVDLATVFQGFVVRAADAKKPGGASVAMTMVDGGGLR